jgi:raffinose/stachyose/melibiose transport system permease protein
VQYTLLAAASVLVALPVVGTYILTQRHFVAGMMSGSLKADPSTPPRAGGS